jgi:D-threo-aldose 1-dehydrogenase
MNIKQRFVGNTELKIDILGLGCAPLGGNFVDLSYEDGTKIINTALHSGMSYFDTAAWYGFGRSERLVGDHLRHKQYVLSSKVGRILKPCAVQNPLDFGMIDPLPFHVIYDYSYDGIMRSYEDSLQRLGLDRIDILLAHDIGAFQHGAENASHFNDLAKSGYKAMSELREQGAVKAIGLGVNETQVCQDALDIGQWDVFLLAGRYTLLEQSPLECLFPACEKAGTSIICGGPFNSGLLVGRDTWNYSKAPEDLIEKTKKLANIADEFNIPLGAAALQFPQAHNIITSVIPGPRSDTELLEIIAWQETKIPVEFWTALKDKNLLVIDTPTPA